MEKYFYLFLVSLFGICCSPNLGTPPDAVQPTPTAQQLAWHEMEFYAFIHFNMNTFTNMEWGMGSEKPSQFNPSELDCRQWARVCQEAGMKGIILTAKHHDGFCLWPSAYTDHSVKNAPWKDGRGDVVQELREACDEFGLALGIYYSPWDRHHPDYGKPAYLTYMRNQLEELLNNYGEIFETWFDGANGGTGYYGGANESRKVDKRTYYDWHNTWDMVHEWQPNTLIFSDAGPDIRWVGNEEGYAFRTMWSNLMRDSVYPGMVDYSKRFASGQENGSHFVPGETNVSIRPGWYYHPYEDHKVRTLHELVEMYYNSIGRNTTWLLNFPVDTRGLIHENDVASLKALTQKIKDDFSSNLIDEKTISTATDRRGLNYSVKKAFDGDLKSYWATRDHIDSASIIVEFDGYKTFNRLVLQEYIALGQRVKSFRVKAHTRSGWKEIAQETTIGYKRILRFETIQARGLRIDFDEAKASITISNLELYHASPLLVPPVIRRNKQGLVRIELPEEEATIYYTMDGSEPTTLSSKYTEPFLHTAPLTVKALCAFEGKSSNTRSTSFDIAPSNWRILETDPEAEYLIDGDPETWWTDQDNYLTIDLGEEIDLIGFNYLPRQDRWAEGIIKNFALDVSVNGEDWVTLIDGEFSNISNNPITQQIKIPQTKTRFIRIRSLATIDQGNPAYAEFSIMTQS